MRDQLLQLLSTYPVPDDFAVAKSLDLITLLLELTPDPFSRHQFTPGHITATGLVLSPARDKALIIHHRRLDRWLLPGGHVETADTSVAASAAREVLEETGVPVTDGVLCGADVHGIPGKPPAEPYHLHHDLLFAFHASTESLAVSEESNDVAWCHPSDFDRYSIPDNVRRAWNRLQAR